MDIELHYEEKGSGPPLILLHGNGESGKYFAHQIEHFSKFFRVIAPDTRGHGRSPRGRGPFTIKRFAEDLGSFMDGLGIEKADLLGFSDGANIAMAFALACPRRVERLVLNGGNLDPGGVKLRYQAPIVLGYKLACLFAGKSPAAGKSSELLGLMVNEPRVPASELSRLTMPVLVIAGTRDMIKESHTRLIHESLPNSRLALLPGDHFIANREPESFNRAVESFLL